MKKTVWIVAALMTVFLALPAAATQGRSKSKGKGKTATTSQSARKSGLSDHERERLAAKGHAFSKAHIRIIVDWFHNPANLQGLPPGLAKREHLPPGLQRHLERNGTLPPGLQKKLQPSPWTCVTACRATRTASAWSSWSATLSLSKPARRPSLTSSRMW